MPGRVRSLLLGAGALVALACPAAPAAADVRLTAGEAGGAYAVKVMSWRDIPFRTVVRQKYDFSCGSAALATLLRYHYGQPVGEVELFKAMWDSGDQVKIKRVGFSLLDMKRTLAARGVKADGYRLSLDQLAALNTPALALINLGRYRHFVVIKGIRGDRVLVGDPALGLHTYNRADFGKIWNGVAFAIHDQPGPAPVFNQASEWRPWATAPVGMKLGDDSLANFSRELPPDYQITPEFSLDPVLH